MSRHVVVIGAGIVGLACAHRLMQLGALMTVIDRAPDGDKCSYGNAGGIAVTETVPAALPGFIWKVPGLLFDPLGPLFIKWTHIPRMAPWLLAFLRAGRESEVRKNARALSSLNSQVYDDLVPLLNEIALGNDLHRVGGITVYSTREAFNKDRAEWSLRSEHGVVWSPLSANELHDLEPDLSPAFRTGVFLPAWSHVSDPKRVVVRLLEIIRRGGAEIVEGEVTGFHKDLDKVVAVNLAGGRSLPADEVVIASGAWSANLAAQLGDRVLLESERGYNTTIPNSNVRLRHELIFAEAKFVVTPLESGVRIGGAAEFAGLNAPANYRRSKALLKLGRQAFPALSAQSGTEWMGQRPATPDSLPVIGRASRYFNAYYAFGHGHLGLTQAATTARLIGELFTSKPTTIDISPFRAARFG